MSEQQDIVNMLFIKKDSIKKVVLEICLECLSFTRAFLAFLSSDRAWRQKNDLVQKIAFCHVQISANVIHSIVDFDE